MVRKTPTCTGPQLVALAVLALVTLQQTEGFQANVRSPIHGQVASPNYTELFYPDRIDETIRLETLPGHRIVVYFADFNIEETGDDASKWGDYVELIDEYDNSSIAKMCGNSHDSRPFAPVLMEQKFKSSSYRMLVRMVSDYGNPVGASGRAPNGFQLYYDFEDIDECENQMMTTHDDVGTPTTKCAHTCINLPGGYRCVCDPGFYLMDGDSFTCHADELLCNSDNMAESGVITPPMRNGKYASSSDCKWSLKANPGERIFLTFDSQFEIEQYGDGTCLFDHLTLKDQSGVLATLCGSTAPAKVIKSVTGWLDITFHSDFNIEGAGFTIHYESKGVQCTLPQPPAYSKTVGDVKKKLDGSSYIKYGEHVKIVCWRNFWLWGNAKLSCLKDGTLSSQMPKCLSM